MRVFLLVAIVCALIAPATVHAQPGPGRPDTIGAVRAASGEIVLVWTPVPTATGYIIFRGETAIDLEPIAFVSTTYYVDLSPSRDVWYGVAATDGTNTSDSHDMDTGTEGEACVSGSGRDVSVNAQSCVHN